MVNPMVPNPKTHKTVFRLLAVGALALLLTAGLAAVASAAPDRMKHDADPSAERPQHRGEPAEFTIELAGTATDQNNETYRVELTGHGVGKVNPRERGADVRGLVFVHAKVLDANGSVIREGDSLARFMSESKGDSTHWRLVGFFGPMLAHRPHLVIRGTANETAQGQWTLEGGGKAVVKLGPDAERAKLDLDVAGSLQKL